MTSEWLEEWRQIWFKQTGVLFSDDMIIYSWWHSHDKFCA